MEPGLRVEILADEADVYELLVSAANGCFAGATKLFLANGSLQDVAGQLDGFPGHPDDTRALLMGEFGPEFAGGGVSLAFALADEQGRGRVQVVVEADEEIGGITETVTLAMGFELRALDEFISGLRRLEADKAGMAVLKGSAPTPA